MLTQGSLGWMGSTFSRLLVWRQGSIMLCQNFHFQSVLIDHMDICAFNRAAGTTLMKAPKKNWCVVWFFILFFSWVRQIIKFIISCPQVGSTVPHTVYEIKAIMTTMDRGRDYAKVRRLTLSYYITRTSKPEWFWSFPKELLESLRSIEGGKRIVLGNAECLARQPSLALAHLLQRKAGFQVLLSKTIALCLIHISVIISIQKTPNVLFLRLCKPLLEDTWDLLRTQVKFSHCYFPEQKSSSAISSLKRC